MIKKVIITAILLAVVAGIGIKGKGILEKRKEEIALEPTPKPNIVTISVVDATDGEIKKSKSFLATLQSDKTIKISTKIAGYIKKIYVKESDRVNKGTLLATIDEEDINSNIKLLKNTLNQQFDDLALAKQIYNRNKKLYNIGGLPKEQLDTSKVIMESKLTAIKATKEKIVQLEHQKSYLKIKAPFSGEIDNIFLYGGDLAVMGKPILSMSSGVKKLIFSYSLDTDIKKSQKVFYRGENIGEITTIRTLAKQGLAQAEIILPNSLNIPIGTNITIDVLIKKVEGCIVPNTAILHKKDGLYLMVYRDNQFYPLKVKEKLSDTEDTVLFSCPQEPIAVGNEVELAKLSAYDKVEIRKYKD